MLDIFAGVHTKFHQAGITNNTLDPSDDDGKGDIEYDIILGLKVNEQNSKFSISPDFIFHHGRFPILNFKYKESEYISVGISIS